MTTPYVGYLDNITVPFVLAPPGVLRPHASTGARVILFLLGIVAAYVHPTTCDLRFADDGLASTSS
jgi:hypothetical protein